MRTRTCLRAKTISIHASLAGGDTGSDTPPPPRPGISIHASLAGGDVSHPARVADARHFNPRLPRGRRHAYASRRSTILQFQSTPPSREATSRIRCSAIHLCISIHASLAGGDRPAQIINNIARRFQSTPPSREATPPAFRNQVNLLFQSTPPSREATEIFRLPFRLHRISIHASLAGGDGARRRPSSCTSGYFNPRLPRGRRQMCSRALSWKINFNPRLPRGRRRLFLQQPQGYGHFNPRLPRGRRLGRPHASGGNRPFQSTPPSREATRCSGDVLFKSWISIHASLAGGDAHCRHCAGRSCAFQSTPPSREATASARTGPPRCSYFNPRLPRGRRLDIGHLILPIRYFNPRLPRGRRLYYIGCII